VVKLVLVLTEMVIASTVNKAFTYLLATLANSLTLLLVALNMELILQSLSAEHALQDTCFQEINVFKQFLTALNIFQELTSVLNVRQDTLSLLIGAVVSQDQLLTVSNMTALVFVSNVTLTSQDFRPEEMLV
jgi:hypothetical protein